ncbi:MULTISPECIES: TrbI/VirB10 family protein [Pandoraea]|uniref:Conjugal transfer protein TrbI n=2 Tax=Pandoraea TaxID=93217 RepID=A0A5E4XKY2_9BURK|nr:MULTISPECIES: TrbI/VirB10 family protein [Pandoraea]VVE14026.1 conjugal transfer protein TrbI [Pandoraea cepalis]VVE36954.1 conjugal transfer protein TrbI [Pandoraea terrigena]
MSDELEVHESPFEQGNPARRRVDRNDIPDSLQSPDREATEDLTRGKRKQGKTIGFLIVVSLLGGGLYYLYGMPNTPMSHRRKSTDTFTPSDTAGAQVVKSAKDAEAQAEDQRRRAALAASASATSAKAPDPNAAAAAAIGAQGGTGPAGANGTAGQMLASAAQAEKQAADAKAEREAQIAASPLQANDVQTLRSNDTGRASPALSPSEQLAANLKNQMRENQSVVDKQMDRVMQLSSAYGGSQGGSAVGVSTRSGQQDQWLASQKADDGVPTRMHAAPAMPIVGEGTPVRAVLVTGLDTDNPGQVTAMVTSDVYDTLTGHSLMIPMGSRLMGEYNHDVRVGQSRVLIAVTRLVRPDGSWIDLSGTPGGEMDGSSGLEGDVNSHFLKIFGSALVIGAATLLLNTTQQNVTVNQGLGTSQMGGTIFAQTLQQVVTNLLSRNKDIPPTITRSGGTQFTFLVRHDLALTPYYRR